MKVLFINPSVGYYKSPLSNPLGLLSIATCVKTIFNGLHSISLKGPISFFVDGFKALYEFLYIFWYSHAYPKFIKKYGLDKTYD